MNITHPRRQYRKRRVLLCVAGVLAAMDAAADIYKCTDAQGEVVYADTPCAGESILFIPDKAPPADAGLGERREKTRQLLRAYRDERAAGQQAAAEAAAAKAERAQNCERARRLYRQVSGAGRLYRVDEDGRRIDFTDRQRADAVAAQQADVEKWCD